MLIASKLATLKTQIEATVKLLLQTEKEIKPQDIQGILQAAMDITNIPAITK